MVGILWRGGRTCGFRRTWGISSYAGELLVSEERFCYKEFISQLVTQQYGCRAYILIFGLMGGFQGH